MVARCVVGGCSNLKYEQEISICKNPFQDDPRPVAKKRTKRRQRWIQFVQSTRDKWPPKQHPVVCSVHFSLFFWPGNFLPHISTLSDVQLCFWRHRPKTIIFMVVTSPTIMITWPMWSRNFFFKTVKPNYILNKSRNRIFLPLPLEV